MTTEELWDRLDGVFVPMFTPFTADGTEVNEPQLRAFVRGLIERGIRILNPAGTTGEFWTLTSQEHRQVLRIVTEEARSVNPQVVVVAGVTTPNVRSTVKLACLARECGADMLQIAPPYYLPVSEADLLEYYHAISSEVDMPVMVYEIPVATGVRFSCELLRRICDRCPNVLAFKAASPKDAMRDFERTTRQFGGRLRVFSAMGAYFSPFVYMTGAAGITDTMANAVPEFGLTLHRLARAGKWEEMNRVYQEAFDVLDIELIYGRAGLKEIGNQCGHDVGPTRYPMVQTLTPADREDIRRRLAAWSFGRPYITGRSPVQATASKTP